MGEKSMTKVTLDDLKFIEDPRNRKAFLIALREVEEEGFDMAEAEAAARRIREIEETPVQKKQTKEDIANDVLVGSTPAERASQVAIKKRNFTHTNAVDLKDYKYWRDPDFGVEKKKPIHAASTQKSGFFDDSAPANNEGNKPRKSSLYEELFGDMSRDHEPAKSTRPTSLFERLNNLIDDDDDDDMLSSNNKVSSETPKSEEKSVEQVPVEEKLKARTNKYQTKEYSEVVKRRAEEFKRMQEENQKKEEAKRLEEEAKKLEQERKELQAKRVELEAREAEAAANAKAQNDNKLTVEVIAPESPKKKAPAKKKTTTAAKPRKRKKKLDSDIKLYHGIVID